MIKSNISISDTGFVFDTTTGESYKINETAQIIINLIKEGKTEEEIVKHFIENFEVEEVTIRQNLYDLNTMMSSFNLLDS